MKNTIANLKFLSAPSSICDWQDKLMEIIDSARSSIKIFWREGFWFVNFRYDTCEAIRKARERGVVIQVIAGPIWLSVQEFELDQSYKDCLFALTRSKIIELFVLKKPSTQTRFIVVDDEKAYLFRDPREDDLFNTSEHIDDGKVTIYRNNGQQSRYPLYTPYVKDALAETDPLPCLKVFEDISSDIPPCQNPNKHLLVLEAFEYDHIRRLGLLDVSHQEIYRELEKHEEKNRRIAHDIAERINRQISEVKDRLSP